MNDLDMELKVLQELQSKLELIVDKDNEWYKKIIKKIENLKK